MIPFVDVVYDGDDYEFEISLEPKDPCCFGFKVVYHNGSFILRELGDHYLEEDVASIPLSLTAYMKVTSFNPVVYEVCYMDKERKQRTVEEEKLRKEAVQELLIYQG